MKNLNVLHKLLQNTLKIMVITLAICGAILLPQSIQAHTFSLIPANSSQLENTHYPVESLDIENAPEISQITSVSQYRDVRPTDWYFQGLQSLVERYGVTVPGDSDGLFRGNKPVTRAELVATLNAALDRMNQLIAAATADY
nr:S-layer homology domain-containing protein [Roseofilum halophilum]